MTLRPIFVAITALTLGACSQPDGSAGDDASPASDQDRVERTAPNPTPQAAPVAGPVTAAIQTQDGPEGSRVSLTRAQVTGDVLTVQ